MGHRYTVIWRCNNDTFSEAKDIKFTWNYGQIFRCLLWWSSKFANLFPSWLADRLSSLYSRHQFQTSLWVILEIDRQIADRWLLNSWLYKNDSSVDSLQCISCRESENQSTTTKKTFLQDSQFCLVKINHKLNLTQRKERKTFALSFVCLQTS